MIIEFTALAWEDYQYWVNTDKEIESKIAKLIKEIQRHPYKGTVKPEALKYSLKGFWSRRISREHRLVYKVSGKKREGQKCWIVQCRFHYDV